MSVPAFAATPTTAELAEAHPAMRQKLQLGDHGHWVMTLQADLKWLGMQNVGPVDGIFGPKTAVALKTFEEAHGLSVTSGTTPKVWQQILSGFGLTPPPSKVLSLKALMAKHPAMSQVLQPGSSGHWVMTLQADLKLLGMQNVGPVDGVFGPKTAAALRDFELSRHLPSTSATNPVVWQDILSGFHLMPPYSDATSSTNASTPKSSSTKSATIKTTTRSTPSSTPSVKTVTHSVAPQQKMIDGRPVVKVLHLIATAYGPSLKDNYPYGPVDAFGQPLQAGMVAVDPRVIPLKSYLYVTGYTDSKLPSGGFLGHAMDTGGAIKGLRLDIFMNANASTVSNFGIEPVTVYVLGK